MKTPQEVFKEVLEDLGFAGYKPDQMTNSDYWLCTCTAMERYAESQKSDSLPNVSGSVYLTEDQIAKLAQIGSQHLYLGAMDEGRISYGGITEILKMYEEIRKTDR